MKKLILVVLVAMLSFGNAYSATKCTTGPGGFCCWDPEVEGPWRPITCD